LKRFVINAICIDSLKKKAMKWKLIVLISILIFSCTKNNKNLCPEYNQFIGKWENKIGDDHVQLEFLESGKIELQSSVLRGKSFKAHRCQASTLQPNPNWISMAFYDKKEKNFLYCSYNLTLDSIFIQTGAVIDDFTLIDNFYGPHLIRTK
jgi:hypothetical protein